jgi:acetylornithine deacetylase/succinyl-diaminopimelate desuccinylase-like protein
MDPASLLVALLRVAGKGPDAVLAQVEAPLRAAGFTPRATRATPRAVLWTRGSPRVLLSGHVDIVPDGEGWQRDPHGGEVAEGRVWGRGACDMLGSVACFVAAAAASQQDAGILLTTDEETTMLAAQHALAEGLLEGFGGVVVGEPTDLAVGIAEKGVYWTRLRTHGRNAHGSMPHLGDNAADRMVRTLRDIQSVQLPGDHPLLGKPTLNLGILRAGAAVNQVPALAEAELDIRYLPGQTSQGILGRLRAATRETFEAQIVSDHAPFETPRDAPLVRAAAAASGGALLGLPYGTEASKFAPAGLSCVILGPGEPGLAHTNRESITLDALRRGVDVYRAIVEAHR